MAEGRILFDAELDSLSCRFEGCDDDPVAVRVDVDDEGLAVGWVCDEPRPGGAGGGGTVPPDPAHLR